jgi:hypothetical protein
MIYIFFLLIIIDKKPKVFFNNNVDDNTNSRWYLAITLFAVIYITYISVALFIANRS